MKKLIAFLIMCAFLFIPRPVLAISPDIKANNSDTPITITTDDTLSIKLDLNSGDGTGQEADWWLVYNKYSAWHYYNLSNGWVPGLNVTHQGALSDLNSYQLNISGLMAGTHTFYFWY